MEKIVREIMDTNTDRDWKFFVVMCLLNLYYASNLGKSEKTVVCAVPENLWNSMPVLGKSKSMYRHIIEDAYRKILDEGFAGGRIITKALREEVGDGYVSIYTEFHFIPK